MVSIIFWRRPRLRTLALFISALSFCLLIYFLHTKDVLVSSVRLDWFKKSPDQPFHVKRSQIDCPSLFKSDEPGKNQGVLSERQIMSEYRFWETMKNCDAMRERFFYPKEPRSLQESEFPLAYVIFVDGQLEQLEMLFNAIYAPQNFYCFHTDFRAHYMVHDFLNRFTRCFDSDHVFVADQSVPIAQTSVSILYAQRACFIKLLMASKRSSLPWKYALTIEGHDFPLRTNREIVEILKLHNGRNDVELVQPLIVSYRYEKSHRVVTDQWGQQIDMEETTMPNLPPPLPDLKIYKGSIASALSHYFVQYLVHSEVSIKVLTWLAKTYMPSELYVSTINHNSILNISGGYPGECMENPGLKSWISRFTVWNTYKQFKCQGKWEKGYCIFGTYDLHMLDQRPEFFAHGFDLRNSAAALDCLQEKLYNRTYLEKIPLEKLRKFEEHYRNLSAVQYEMWTSEGGDRKFMCAMCDNCDH